MKSAASEWSDRTSTRGSRNLNQIATIQEPRYQHPSQPLEEFLDRYDGVAEEHVYASPRYRIHYSVLGEGPPLYVIQGICSTRRLFAPLATELARDFKVVLYDLPGVNDDDGADLSAYGTPDLAGDLFALASHLGDEQFWVMGNSFGTAIALQSMRQRPERITKGVVVGGFVHRPLTPFERLHFCVMGHWPGRLKNLPFMAALTRYNHGRELGYRSDELIHFLLEQSMQTPVRTTAAQVLAVDATDLRRLAGEIEQMVLVVHGNEDRLVAVDHAADLANRLPRVQIMLIPQCGHLPHLSHPELLAHAAKRFFLEDAPANLVQLR